MKLKCNNICSYIVAEGGGEERGGGDEGEQGLERCHGGIHGLGLATIFWASIG